MTAAPSVPPCSVLGVSAVGMVPIALPSDATHNCDARRSDPAPPFTAATSAVQNTGPLGAGRLSNRSAAWPGSPSVSDHVPVALPGVSCSVTVLPTSPV